MSYKKISQQTPKNNAIRPNKLLGQNFLRDKNVLRKIIAAANLTADDTVLEVGPGEGILTEALAQSAGRVIAVEKDKNLAALLKKKFKDSKSVEIVEGDILSFLPRICHSREGGNPVRGKLQQESRPWIPPYQVRGELSQARDDKPFFLAPYKVVANIPYYLTSHLIRLLLESTNPPQDIILMVQKEVAKRICAKPPEMSLLAVSVQFYAEPQIIASVSKNAFWPKPKVDSAIIRITPRPWHHPQPISVIPAKVADPDARRAGIQTRIDQLPIEQLNNLKPGSRIKCGMTKTEIENFFRVLHAGFSHPRKQLLNNLSAELKIPREDIAKFLQATGLNPGQRAETLSVEDWLKLTKQLFN